MRTKTLSFFLIFIILPSSCKKDSHPTEPFSNVLTKTNWQLVQIDTVDGGRVSVNQADTILLTFDDERRISGKSPGLCGNTYFGVYSISSDGSIRTDSLVTTKIYCSTSQYHYYYYLLTRAQKYQRHDSRLNLYCDNQSRRLVFQIVS